MRSRFFGFDFDGHAFDYLKARFFEGLQFLGVVRQNPDLAKSEVEQDLGALLVFAGVDGETKLFVGFDGVGAFVLQGVGPYFIDDPDAAAFLLLIDDGSAPFGFDHFHRLVELRPAIAFDRTKNISGQALRMDADKRGNVGTQVALIYDDELLVAGERPVSRDLKIAGSRW